MIETENLILRPFTLDDTGKVYLMSLEDGMKKWIPDQVYADENEAREVLEFLITCYNKPDPKVKPFVLGIELRDSKELIGHVGLSPFEDSVEIGYAVENKHHGKGYATEAIKAMCQYALEKFNIDKIIGIVASENKGSVKALEKAEFSFIEEKERNAFGRLALCKTYIFS
jgi:[ribosomal protein S5]-alanine N-acetyltransferase